MIYKFVYRVSFSLLRHHYFRGNSLRSHDWQDDSCFDILTLDRVLEAGKFWHFSNLLLLRKSTYSAFWIRSSIIHKENYRWLSHYSRVPSKTIGFLFLASIPSQSMVCLAWRKRSFIFADKWFTRQFKNSVDSFDETVIVITRVRS